MDLPYLSDGLIACVNRHYHATPFRSTARGRKGLQHRLVCGQDLPSLPSPPSSCSFFAIAPIFAWPKTEKCFKPAKNRMETLATQARASLTFFFF